MGSDTLAHDINNLLTIVAGCRERLAGAPDLTPQQRADLDRIAVATAHAGSLTAQLIQAGRDADSRDAVSDVGKAIRDAVTLLEPALGSRIRIAVRSTADASWASISEAEIGQVLINLGLNARDAMPGGGVLTIASTVTTLDAEAASRRRLRAGTFVVIDVADTGAGMSAETRAQAFDRFFTAKAGGGGTGLGLASVKRVVERRGGGVELHSVAGEGTTFTLWLPQGRAPRPADPLAAIAAGGAAGSGETVLVVDDEPVIREIVTENLQALGYRTLTAGSAQEAVAIAAAARIDLFVTDLELPDAHGGEVARRLAAASPSARVLIISGSGDGASAASMRGTAFLQKPFTGARLARAVRDLLDGAPAAVEKNAPQEESAAAPASSEPLLDTLPAAVFVIQRRRFVYVNAAFADLMGLDAAELIGRDSLERVHPDDRAIAPHDADPASATARVETQIRVRRPDGAERSLGVTTVGIVFEGVPAILGTASDLTLQPDVLNVSVRMAALGRLAGGVAHDFNNLLLVIGGQIDRLRPGVAGSRELTAGLDTIATAAERAAELTDRLLSFGRRQLLTPQVLDLSGVIADVEPQLRARLGGAIALVVDCADDLPHIHADRPRLREVLWHLADNARDAMPDGGTMTLSVDRVRIDSDLKARWAFLALGGEFVRLRVIDTGRGMDPEVLPHVFEPFYTTKGRGRGAGMGLASVYGIVKQSAGYVFVERTGADGTCVTILLPGAGSLESVSEPAAGAVSHPVAARPRILLVEDDMAVRELLADLLSAHGFDVSSAETAEQAELQAAHAPFDLLLSDIDLPGMSGAGLAAVLAARTPGLRLILMSGYPDDGEIARARLQDKVTLLRKPFSTTTLVERIRQILGH